MLKEQDLRTRLERGESQRQIAAAEGCSASTVRHWMGVHGLESPARKRGEAAPPGRAQTGGRPLPPPLAFGANGAERNTNAIGAVTEARVVAALTASGYPCYLPFGVGKADLVIETADGLRSVQVKTAVLAREGTVLVFRSYSVTRAGGRAGYRGSVDFFAVACPELPEVYLVPVADAADSVTHLRLTKTVNGQSKGVRFADDYLLRG